MAIYIDNMLPASQKALTTTDTVESGRNPAGWWDRHWWCGPLCCSSLALAVFLATVAPDITWGDSGDLITASYRLGVPHPSGYPLYSLLGKLLSLVPLGNVAFRYNVISALYAAGAVFMVAFLTWRATGRTVPAVAAGWVLAFNDVFWYHAHLAEVYSLHALFLTLILYQLLRFVQTDRNRYLYYYALCCGLSFGNHMATGFMIFPSTVIVLLWRPRIVTDVKLMAKLIGLLAIPLGVYLYLPIAAAHTQAVAWGNPTSWERFKVLVLGEQYYHLFSPHNILRNLHRHLWQHVTKDFNSAAILIAGIGAAYGLLRHTVWTAGLIVGALTYLIYLLSYNINDLSAYFISPDVFIVLLSGLGLEALRRMSVWWLAKDFPQTKQALAMGVVVIVSGVLVGWQLYSGGVTRKMYRRSTEAKEYCDTVMSLVKGRTLVLTRGDGNTFSLWYQKYVANPQADLTVIDLRMCGMNYNEWYLSHLRREVPGLKVVRCVNLNYNRSFLLDHNRPLFDTFLLVTPGFSESAKRFKTDRNVWRIIPTKLHYVKQIRWERRREPITTRPVKPTLVKAAEFGVTRDFKRLTHRKEQFGRDEWAGLLIHWRRRFRGRAIITWYDPAGQSAYTHVFDRVPYRDTLVAALTPRFFRKSGHWRVVVGVPGHRDWAGSFEIR